jgi:hypothetical protein
MSKKVKKEIKPCAILTQKESYLFLRYNSLRMVLSLFNSMPSLSPITLIPFSPPEIFTDNNEIFMLPVFFPGTMPLLQLQSG